MSTIALNWLRGELSNINHKTSPVFRCAAAPPLCHHQFLLSLPPPSTPVLYFHLPFITCSTALKALNYVSCFITSSSPVMNVLSLYEYESFKWFRLPVITLQFMDACRRTRTLLCRSLGRTVGMSVRWSISWSVKWFVCHARLHAIDSDGSPAFFDIY